MISSRKIFSALSYGLASFTIIIINKIILTTYKFPSFIILGYSQIVFTLLIIICLYTCKLIRFSNPISVITAFKIFPLPFFNIGNILFGLGGTGALNLPMFTILRRLTNIFLLIGESIFLKMNSTLSVKISTLVIMFGAAVAASFDFTFDAYGYGLVLGNDLCTAANSISLKKKLIKKDLNKFELQFYNALAVWPLMSVILYISGDIKKVLNYNLLGNIDFILLFFLSSILGVILIYTTIDCTHHTSPLTTSIVGVIKNILVTYIGMFIGGDYEFNWSNFIGLNISAAGAIMYTGAVFQKHSVPSTSSPSSVIISKS